MPNRSQSLTPAKPPEQLPSDPISDTEETRQGQFETRKVEGSPSEHGQLSSSTKSSQDEPSLGNRTISEPDTPTLPLKQQLQKTKRLNSAIKKGDMKSVARLCQKNPWLITKHPEVMKLEGDWGSGMEGNMVIKFCLSPKGRGALEQALKITGLEALTAPHGAFKFTPLDFLSQQKESLPSYILKGLPEEAFLTKQRGGNTLLHEIATSGQSDSCRVLKARFGEEPFNQKNWSGKTPSELLAEAEKKTASTPVSTPVTPYKPQPNKPQPKPDIETTPVRNTDYLDLAHAPSKPPSRSSTQLEGLNLDSSVTAGNARLEKQASRLVKQLGTVGVNGLFNYFPGEKKDHFYSLGDENGSIMLLQRLVSLGTPHIQLRMELHDKVRGDDLGTPKRISHMQEVALYKLASLLPNSNFDPAKGVPQDIRIGNSVVHILDFDQNSDVTPRLEIGFGDAPRKGKQPENYMTVKPYRFGSDTQHVTLDANMAMAKDSFPLNLPPNSYPHDRIPGNPANAKTLKSEKEWIEGAFRTSGSKPQGAEGLARICRECRKGKVHSSVIYGIHHPDVKGDADTLLKHWVNALEERGRPALILINSSRIPPAARTYFEESQIPILEPTQENLKESLDALISSGRTGICMLPDMPKPVFEHLIHSSDLPALVEGANTTSHLLETGHPYLSVLPSGKTPVPYEMGYPLEALKAEAFSYKLRAQPQDIKRLALLKNMVEQGKFTDALKNIEADIGKVDAQIAMSYIYTPVDAIDDSGQKKVTIQGLLKKGEEQRLGELEKQALISALDPSQETLAGYIDECLDPESVTAHHHALQQMHITQSFNDSVLQALLRFADLEDIDL